MRQIMTAQHMSRAFLGLGGNIDDPVTHFRRARQELAGHPQITIRASSPLYRTPPVGGPDGQPDYLNAVLEIGTALTAWELLAVCQHLEREAGRVRTVRWGPRPLDIDLLLFSDQTCNSEILTLPHPRLHQRHFVLLPLCDLAPDLNHPVINRTIGQILDTLGPEPGISRLEKTW